MQTTRRDLRRSQTKLARNGRHGVDHELNVLIQLDAQIRRAAGNPGPRIEVAGLTLDTRSMQVLRDGSPLKLTPQEFKLVSYLMHQRGRVVSQLEITEHLYAQDFERESNSIEVLVGRVRRKLGEGVVQTRRGFGYFIGEAD